MHPCLADRFLTPRLVETFKLLASDDSPIGDEAFKVASQGLEIGLLEDPEEKLLELEFEQLADRGVVRPADNTSRRWRARLLWHYWLSKTTRSRTRAEENLREAHKIISRRHVEIARYRRGWNWEGTARRTSTPISDGLLQEADETMAAAGNELGAFSDCSSLSSAPSLHVEVDAQMETAPSRGTEQSKPRARRRPKRLAEEDNTSPAPKKKRKRKNKAKKSSKKPSDLVVDAAEDVEELDESASSTLTPLPLSPSPDDETYQARKKPKRSSKSGVDMGTERKRSSVLDQESPSDIKSKKKVYAKTKLVPLTYSHLARMQVTGVGVLPTSLTPRGRMERFAKQVGRDWVHTRADAQLNSDKEADEDMAGLLQKAKAPPMAPPVWAQSRQELCEALPYYRAYQSGLYMHKRVAYGYLLDGFPAPRDMWAADGRVIISHGGGQAVRTEDAEGQTKVSLSADHTREDARIDTLMRAAETRTPIVLIAGEGYALLPWRLGCQYAILGWYWVSATWYEAEPVAAGMDPPEGRDYFHRLKVRFDWVDSQGMPWWLIPGEGSWSPRMERQKGKATEDTAHGHSQSIQAGNSNCQQGTAREEMATTKAFRPDGTGASEASNSRYIDEARNHRLLTSMPVNGLPTPLSPHSSVLHDLDPNTASTPTPRKRTRLSPLSPCPSSTPPPSPPVSMGSSPDDKDLMKLQKRLWKRSLDVPTTYLKEGKIVYPSPPRATANGTPAVQLDGPARSVPGEEGSKDTSIPGDHILSNSRPEDVVESQRSPETLGVRKRRRRRPRPKLIEPDTILTYSSTFLQHVPSPASCRPPYGVVPPPPRDLAEIGEADTSEDSQSGTRGLWRGWVCTCGRANCRYRWELCECLGCGRQIASLGEEHVFPASAVRRDEEALGEAEEGFPHLLTSLGYLDSPSRGTVVSYILPDAGTVYHIMHDSATVADKIWESYQRSAIATPRDAPLFQRRALKSNTVKGALLSQQFAINSGAAYKYIVETLSYPFEESPECVVSALEVIKNRVARVLGTRIEFNEILSVMYREGQKMSWHDDGEYGLGPVVAALSLGSTAVMSFRPKRPKVPKDVLAAMGDNEDEEKRARKFAPAVLSLSLSHGDVVIMSGRAIQRMYDHRVIPSGLRVAATARVIGA